MYIIRIHKCVISNDITADELIFNKICANDDYIETILGRFGPWEYYALGCYAADTQIL